MYRTSRNAPLRVNSLPAKLKDLAGGAGPSTQPQVIVELGL